jgi:hypothetical protein
MRFALSSPLQKNIWLCSSGKSSLQARPVLSQERGVAQRHQRGAGCGGRGLHHRRTMQTRTAKTCGPDTPTLVSSLAEVTARRRWQKSPVTGESPI